MQMEYKLWALSWGMRLTGRALTEIFLRPARGETFDLEDLSRDPEAEQVAKGFLQYLKILAVLKEVRDRSRVNSHAPIVLAGLAPGQRSCIPSQQ